MTRVLALAVAIGLSVAAALAAPVSAQEARVALAGKAAEAIYAEIQTSARHLCRDLYRNDPFGPGAKSNCVRATVAAAVSRLPAEVAQALPAATARNVGSR